LKQKFQASNFKKILFHLTGYHRVSIEKNVAEIVAVFSGNRKKRITHSGKNAEIFKANQVVHVCHNSHKQLVSPNVLRLTSLQQKQTSLVIKMTLLCNKKRE
jgi:hypothetical protein